MKKPKCFDKLRVRFPGRAKNDSGDGAGTTSVGREISNGFTLEYSEVKPPYTPPSQPAPVHRVAASDITSALDGMAQSQMGDRSSTLIPTILPLGPSPTGIGKPPIADQEPSTNQSPTYESTTRQGLVGHRSSMPKLAIRTNTFDTIRTLDPPELGQPGTRFRALPPVRASLGLDPGFYGPPSSRYQNSANIPQPLLEETPKLKELFPLTISVKSHVCFNTNHQVQRLLTNAVLDTVQAASEDEEWSYETDVIDLPDQEIEWYKHAAYTKLEPRQHLQKITDRHTDVRDESLYLRHGCFTVEGPPELRQNLKYARFAEVSELAQKSIHAICGFIHEHQFERFHLDVFWEYSTLHLTVPEESAESSFHDIIRKGLKGKLVTNFRGQEYIPRCDLAKFQQDPVIKDIISQDKSINEGDRKGIFDLAISRATHLLLMCIYIKRPIKLFKHLVEIHLMDDCKLESFVGQRYPPLIGEPCQQEECLETIRKIYKCAPEFLPLKVGKDPRFKVWKKDMVIPLHFFDNNKPLVTPDESSDSHTNKGRESRREIGRGANGHVLEVWAEPSLHSLPGSLQQTFALKKASSIKPKAFESESIMLEKLYDYPHGHITPHYGSWQQDDHTYILTPRARCNLRSYLTTVQPPRLKTTAVKWFFDQLYGLADAIKHVHHIKPAGTLMNPEPADLSYGYHHDIKPENILVFEKVANAHPVLQIADFGAGSLYDADAHNMSRPVDTVRGTRTYFAPVGEPATRPVDMWSLGCCFLELTLWLFGQLGSEHSQEQFTEDRKYYPGHNPLDTDDGFWYRREDGEIEVKEPVITRIESLRVRYCKDMEVFQILLDAIRRPDGQKSLLTIDKVTRTEAPALVDCLNSIRKHIDLHMRTASVDDEDDLYARYFARNVSGSEQALTPIIPFKLRTALTTNNDPSSPRDSFEEEEEEGEPTTFVPTPLNPGQRHRSTSSLILEAGQGTEHQIHDRGSSLAVNEANDAQRLSSPEDSMEADIARLQREN